MSTHFSIDSNRVTDFGSSIPTSSEVFVSLKPEITLVDATVLNFPIVSEVELFKKVLLKIIIIS